MNFLLDVGISPRLGRLLETEGHTFRYVPDHYPNTLADSRILEEARLHNEVVITHDLDFGTHLAFSGKQFPSVILFRIHHISAQVFYEIIRKNWVALEDPLLAGSLIIIEQSAIRIRKLPI